MIMEKANPHFGQTAAIDYVSTFDSIQNTIQKKLWENLYTVFYIINHHVNIFKISTCEPRHEKINSFYMQKQRRRSASQ